MSRGSFTITCKCNAYRFPHRWGSGKCTKMSAVAKYWEDFGDSCSECPFFMRQKEPHGERSGECLLLEEWNKGGPDDAEQCRGINSVVSNL